MTPPNWNGDRTGADTIITCADGGNVGAGAAVCRRRQLPHRLLAGGRWPPGEIIQRSTLDRQSFTEQPCKHIRIRIYAKMSSPNSVADVHSASCAIINTCQEQAMRLPGWGCPEDEHWLHVASMHALTCLRLRTGQCAHAGWRRGPSARAAQSSIPGQSALAAAAPGRWRPACTTRQHLGHCLLCTHTVYSLPLHAVRIDANCIWTQQMCAAAFGKHPEFLEDPSAHRLVAAMTRTLPRSARPSMSASSVDTTDA